MCETNNKTRGCWNCRLYDDCNIKYYVTNICDKYKDCRDKIIDNDNDVKL